MLLLCYHVLVFTCGGDRHRAHLFGALHDFNPLSTVFVRPFRSIALINPLVGRRHPGDHQLKHSVLPGNQSDAAVGVAAGKLGPYHYVSLWAKHQDFLGRRPPFDRPGDGEVGRMGELPGDVARQGEVTSFWDNWGRGLRGHLEGVGND